MNLAHYITAKPYPIPYHIISFTHRLDDACPIKTQRKDDEVRKARHVAAAIENRAERSKRIVKACSKSGFSVKEMVKKFGYSESAITELCKTLVAVGTLRRYKKGSTFYYKAV